MSSTVLKGQGASPGIAIGLVYPLPSLSPIPHYRLPKKKIPFEKKRFEKAFLQAEEEWEKSLEKLSRLQAREQIRILQSHLMILKDLTLFELCERYIEEDSINAEWAVELTGQHLSLVLAQEDQASSLKRSEDIQAVILKILHHLCRLEPLFGLNKSKIKNHILVADYLSPEMVPFLKRLNVLGFITRVGGRNSHTMILARSLCIPAISGVANALETLALGTRIILNGFEGKVLVDPSPKEFRRNRELVKKHELLENLLLAEAKREARTLDKKRIRTEANVEFLEEIPALLKCGAEGIGLFRTESLFWNQDNPPSFKEQSRYYRKIVERMKEKPVTFRTMDLSSEQWLGRIEANPALGLRGIRFGLKEGLLLREQLKALLTAGPIKILLPMVSSLEEIDSFKKLLKEVEAELKREGMKLSQKIPIGMMIEVPAAGLLTDLFGRHVDFFAIGSNDLIQYTLAMDRGNEYLSESYSSYHPAILKILHQIVQNALKAKRPIYLCGELGADPLFIPVLLGLGIRHFSMSPLSIPRAKKIIRSLSTKQCEKWLKKLLTFSRAKEIEKELGKMRLKLDTPWWAG